MGRRGKLGWQVGKQLPHFSFLYNWHLVHIVSELVRTVWLIFDDGPYLVIGIILSSGNAAGNCSFRAINLHRNTKVNGTLCGSFAEICVANSEASQLDLFSAYLERFFFHVLVFICKKTLVLQLPIGPTSLSYL